MREVITQCFKILNELLFIIRTTQGIQKIILEIQEIGEDGLFSPKEIQAALFDNSGLSAHLLKPELLDRCKQNPKVSIADESVDLTNACNILESWDITRIG